MRHFLIKANAYDFRKVSVTAGYLVAIKYSKLMKVAGPITFKIMHYSTKFHCHSLNES